MPITSSFGVTANWKATCEKLCQLSVAAWKPSKPKYAATAPSTPPASASTSDSSSTENTTGAAWKPMARRVAISRVREETAEYMVLSAPNTAPKPIINAMMVPRPVTSCASPFDWPAKYSVSRSTWTSSRGSLVIASLKAWKSSFVTSLARTDWKKSPRLYAGWSTAASVQISDSTTEPPSSKMTTTVHWF